MYPILILRAEALCLVLLGFLFFTSRTYNIDNNTKAFKRLSIYATIHVCFDIITVLTVNNQVVVPTLLNDICHIIFYLSAMLYSVEVAVYAISMCHPAKVKKYYIIGYSVVGAYLCILPLLKIEYVEVVGQGTFSSSGTAAYLGYGIGFFFFIYALIVMLTNWKKVTKPVKLALIPMIVILIVVEISQAIWKELLFTGSAITIVTIGFFFSLENPVQVFQRKAMTDALTGVRSRNSYESDISKLDQSFKANPNDAYTFVFCDLNGLRNVNNKYGHAEGDNYITFIASAISRFMKHASSVYRIGGDEFLVMYYKVSEKIVQQEIRDLQNECLNAAHTLDYAPFVSAGYAISSSKYKSLKEVVKTADYEMYQNKSIEKYKNTYVNRSLGTGINYSGLTDKLFDAMCSSNDRNYPFILNIETNVTRISPAWKEYFGLSDEFFMDFNSVWKEKIHPDYIEGYNDDIAAVMNGHKKYHNYEYLAKRADGEYVRVSCHGSIYRDSGDSTAYFTGFMVNHALDYDIDKDTGLRSFETLTTRVCKLVDAEIPFSILKLKLYNFARVNMLYGYSGGNEIIFSIAQLLKNEVATAGEVFSEGGINFTILLNTNNKNTIQNTYDRISQRLYEGVETNLGAIPINVCGGAIINNGKRMPIQSMRRCLVYVTEESMYSHRNELVFFDWDDATTQTDLALLSEIHADALADMEYFKLRYQPIVDVNSRKTLGAEALLYWIHPIIGEVSPGHFIGFLENDPCYYRLGLHILDRAIRDAKQIRSKIPEFWISVNITATQLQNEEFLKSVVKILDSHDFPHDGLILELTERCKEMDHRFLSEKIADIRNTGVRVAFDDLGTGYSTISLMLDIPVDEIKLDRLFVKELKDRNSYQLFVRSLILGSTSSDHPYTICFEGVETEEMFDHIAQYGNYLIQGYFFSKPLLIDAFNEYINNEK